MSFVEHFQLNILSPGITVKRVGIASYTNRAKVRVGANVSNIQSPGYGLCFGDQFEHQSHRLRVDIRNAEG